VKRLKVVSSLLMIVLSPILLGGCIDKDFNPDRDCGYGGQFCKRYDLP
jgi:hypothetical protein